MASPPPPAASSSPPAISRWRRDDARFAINGINIGLFCSTPMVALSRAVGRKAALEMLLTGDMVDAPRAQEIGLVNRVVPPEKLDDEVPWRWPARSPTNSPLAVAIGKEAFYRQAEMGLEAPMPIPARS